MEDRSYQEPDYLRVLDKPKTIGNFLRGFWGELQAGSTLSRIHQEDEVVWMINSELSIEDAEDIAVRSAIGQIRFPKIIPSHMTKDVVARVGSLSTSKKLYALYTMMCSSLYYETLAGQINLRKGRKLAGRLHELFKDHIGALSTDGLFTSSFGDSLKFYKEQHPNHPNKELSEDLLSILDYPSKMLENFKGFFDNLQ